MELNLDTVIRLMSVGGSTLLLIIVMTGTIRWPLKYPLAGLIIGGAAYLINTSVHMNPPPNISVPLDLISIITPFWLWLFARRLFDRDPRQLLVILIAATCVASWAIIYLVPTTGLLGFYLNHLVSLALIFDLIYTALSGLGDDLMQKRRLIRMCLPILVGLQAGGILMYELWFGTSDNSPLVQTINAGLIFALVLFTGLVLLKTDADLLLATGKNNPEPPEKSQLTASETVLNEKLVAAMRDGHYHEAGLTIQSLARHLGTPEHRLRALINQKLGHRNFSSFLNGYRISEAKQKLADRELVDLPILTIAMDLGYNSLAPFNRAFRAETGVTPSDFRKSAIDQN